MYRINKPDVSEISVELPTSKSLTHRALILGALNEGNTEIIDPLSAEDTQITLNSLNNMGAGWVEKENKYINSKPIGVFNGQDIFLGNSGSSARFLIPLAGLLGGPIKFYGVDRLHKRPFSELFEALRTFGANIECKNDSLPADITGKGLNGGNIAFGYLPSSQVVSGLMMAGLWMKKELVIELPEKIPSLPYISMTYKIMKNLDLDVSFEANEIRVKNEKPKSDWEIRIEKDMSAASYWVIYGLINGIKVTLPGAYLPSLQGDAKILEIAESVGADVTLYSDRIEIEGEINSGLSLDCGDIPDLVPALSVLGMFAPENFELKNVKHLEFKESNRIAAIRENIGKLGGKTDYKDSTLIIEPQKEYNDSVLDSFADHRIAMSFAMAGTKIPGTIIKEPESVVKSYPDFWKDFTHWEALSL